MSLNPTQYPNYYNVYQNEQNDTDNRTNSARKLQPLNQSQPSKASVLSNNKNIDDAKSSVPLLKKIRKKFIKNCRNIISQNNKNKHLFEAAKKGNADLIKKWIDAGADLNTTNRYGVSALRAAASNGHVDAAEVLLSHPDIDVNIGSKYGGTPLSQAACYGHVDIVILLLSHPNSCNKIDVNKPNDFGQTPLFQAAYEGHIEIVLLLLTHPNSRDKIDVNKKNNYDETPLGETAKYGQTEAANVLLSHPKIKLNEPACNYLDRVVRNNDVDSIQTIVFKGFSEEVCEYLHTKASETGNTQLLTMLSRRQDCLVNGYSNTKALGGHEKAYSGKGDVPEGILDTVKKYQNPYSPKS
ncbi:MAG: ankyrin repeat domain-containing protein [Desulfobacteraceae bacterium]|nr:ankyrin repeat domain-containing protein [Desulfobacteraceae bacterium]